MEELPTGVEAIQWTVYQEQLRTHQSVLTCCALSDIADGENREDFYNSLQAAMVNRICNGSTAQEVAPRTKKEKDLLERKVYQTMATGCVDIFVWRKITL